LGNLSADAARAALVIADACTPAEVGVGAFVGEAGPLNTRTLTRFNKPLIEEFEISEPEPHWIESADGTKVHVWVLKPAGFKPGRKYPAVLEIHGGPHAQYGETFFHEFQVLAAAGYVVVYSNPRGSKGYGDGHCAAIKGNWGQADWRDVQAVIAFMKALPFVDTARLGVMGGSYGGYMTNWVIAHTHEFAAAITDRCVSNLVSMVGSSDLPLVPGEYWRGNSWDDTEALWEQSPLKHFGNVKTPTLIIHSEGDLRCNVEQAEQVFAALKLRKIPTRFVRYPSSTSHGLSRSGPPDLRIHRLQQIVSWWKEHLG
jgi:dipeptidyl aminopeptidase/acylaminoacyl peptidase